MSEETLSRIAGWCEAEREFEIEGSTLTVAGDPPLALALEISDDALTLAHVHSETGPPRGFAEKAVDMLTQRGSMIAGEVVTGTDSTAVHIRYPIYLEGLNRQSFLVGVREITGTVDGLNRLTDSATSQPVEQPAAEAATRPAPPPSQPDPEPVAAAAPVTPAAPAPWSPTHQVPAAGMAAWSDPDPSLAPVTTLGGGVQLRVDEQRGAWASVTGSNGWTGWVDARILQAIGVAAPAAAPAWSAPAASSTPGSWAPAGQASSGGLHILGLVGGIMMFVSAFLDWAWSSAMDISVAAVWPIYHAAQFNQPRLGHLLILFGILAVVAAVMPQVNRSLSAIAGAGALILVAGIVLGFLIDGWNTSLADLVRVEWIGLWTALVGGVLALIPGPRLH